MVSKRAAPPLRLPTESKLLPRACALDRGGALVGILSLGDAAPDAPQPVAAEALADISAPGGAHSQADEDDPHGVVAPTTEAEGVPGVLHFTDDEPS